MTATLYRKLDDFSRTELRTLIKLAGSGRCCRGYCDLPGVGFGRRFPGTAPSPLCQLHFDTAEGTKIRLSGSLGSGKEKP